MLIGLYISNDLFGAIVMETACPQSWKYLPPVPYFASFSKYGTKTWTRYCHGLWASHFCFLGLFLICKMKELDLTVIFKLCFLDPLKVRGELNRTLEWSGRNTHLWGRGETPHPPVYPEHLHFLFRILRSDTFCSRFPLDKEFPHFRKWFGLGVKNGLDQSRLSWFLVDHRFVEGKLEGAETIL